MDVSKGHSDMSRVQGIPGRPGMSGLPGVPGGPGDDFQLPPADVSHIRRKWLDVEYAPASDAHRLDIYLPDEGDGPFPVIVSIHGGAFRECDKGDEQIMPMLEGLKRGYAAVSLNYRMSGEAKFPVIVQDVKAAIRWIRANAEKYLFDPTRIAAWGGSAGAYLATMLGVSAGVKELEDLSLGNADQPCNVQAVVAWFGPTDFGMMDRWLAESGIPSMPGMEHDAADSPESLLLGAKITTVPELVKAANPETYVSPAAPPFFLQHGTMDMVVPHQSSVRLAEKLAGAIGKRNVRLELLEGAGHADPRFDAPDNVKKVFAWLDARLK